MSYLRNMSHPLCLALDRLQEGEEQEINASLDPSFLDLMNDKELKTSSPVHVTGKVSRVSDFISVNMDVKVKLSTTCSMCSDPFTFPIELKNWVLSESLDSLKGGVWDLREPLREAILIETPFFMQCGASNCKNIEEIRPYLRKNEEVEGHNPFTDFFKTVQK